MLKEFKDFLLKGNIIDLAVAFVMGLAFPTVAELARRQHRHADHRRRSRQARLPRTSRSRSTSRIFHYGSFITDVIQFDGNRAPRSFLHRQAGPDDPGAPAEPDPTAEETVSDEERRHQELLAALRTRIGTG